MTDREAFGMGVAGFLMGLTLFTVLWLAVTGIYDMGYKDGTDCQKFNLQCKAQDYHAQPAGVEKK